MNFNVIKLFSSSEINFVNKKNRFSIKKYNKKNFKTLIKVYKDLIINIERIKI